MHADDIASEGDKTQTTTKRGQTDIADSQGQGQILDNQQLERPTCRRMAREEREESRARSENDSGKRKPAEGRTSASKRPPYRMSAKCHPVQALGSDERWRPLGRLNNGGDAASDSAACVGRESPVVRMSPRTITGTIGNRGPDNDYTAQSRVGFFCVCLRFRRRVTSLPPSLPLSLPVSLLLVQAGAFLFLPLRGWGREGVGVKDWLGWG